MGLLDAIFQTGGGGQGGGLLDFLRNNAQNQDMSSSGLQSSQQYGQQPMMAQPMPIFPQPNQPGPLDNAQWPAGPNGAPSQANAQMQPVFAQQPTAMQPPPIAPQTAPAPEPGFGDRVTAALRTIGHPGGLINRMADASVAFQNGQVANPAARQANATAVFLRSHGVPEADISAAVGDGRMPGNPEILKTIMTENIKKYDYRPSTPEERKAAGITGPMFINTATGEPKFGPPQTNIQLSTEKTGQAELVKQAVDSHVAAQNAARESQKRVGLYDAMEKASQGFVPGATAEMRLTAKKYLKDAGLIQGTDVPDGEVMQMLSRTLAIHAQPKGQGAVSNFEREMFAKSLPNMTQSPDGLKQAIGISRKLEQFDQQVAQIYRESAGAHNGLPNYLEVQDRIAKLGSPLSDRDMSAMGSGGGAAAPPAATGWTNIGNGVKIRSK